MCLCSKSGAVFSYKLRYIVGFGLVEMAISTNPKPTIYRNLYENTECCMYDPVMSQHKADLRRTNSRCSACVPTCSWQHMIFRRMQHLFNHSCRPLVAPWVFPRSDLIFTPSMELTINLSSPAHIMPYCCVNCVIEVLVLRQS